MNVRNRGAAALLAVVTIWWLGSAVGLPAAAQTPSAVRLFKLVSVRDEIVIGIEPALLGAAGMAPDVQRLAALLADKGQLTVWQYAPHKDAGGALVQAPLRQVAVFRSDALRIEPYTTPLPIRAPGEAK